MSVQNDVSFQGKVPQREKHNNTVVAACGAFGGVIGGLAADPLIDKSLREDTFLKTAKKCVESHTKDWKAVFSGGAKYILRNDKLADKIFNLKNSDKRLAVAAMAIDLIGMFGLLKLTMDCFSRFRHRNDA